MEFTGVGGGGGEVNSVGEVGEIDEVGEIGEIGKIGEIGETGSVGEIGSIGETGCIEGEDDKNGNIGAMIEGVINVSLLGDSTCE